MKKERMIMWKEVQRMNRKIPKGGIIKCRTDKLGRISMPAQFRRALGIKPEEEVSMMFDGKCMYVFKETEEEILERKCNDIMSASFGCEDMNGEDREQLGELLMKLIGECVE
jgi:bifunctional DNA-binding transcriptional regulator/antitoxin component of YhaV-PrlF toxin-antitoxin module